MIVALAGRRPDAPGAPKRFPPENALLVRRRLRRLLRTLAPETLVTSAACGADLLALDEAVAVDIHCRVVLPTSPERFRCSSVIDRGAEWGEVFDRVLTRVDLVPYSVQGAIAEDQAYAAACRAILDEAARLGRERESPVNAIVVWDGLPRPRLDITNNFRLDAQARGLNVIEILTLARRNPR